MLDEDYLRYRIRSTAYLAEKAEAAGVPMVRPPGGHAVYLDAKALLPHIPPSQYPAQALAVELYRVGGVRGRGDRLGDVRHAGTPTAPRRRRRWNWCGWPFRAASTPRATSTTSGEVIGEVARRRAQLRGLPHRGAGALAAALHGAVCGGVTAL